MHTTLACALLAVAAMSAALPAGAQAYPSKPVRVVVGLAAGGGTDVIARILTARLADALGQPVVVENRVGVAGMVAAETVAKAAPDGYTVLFTPNGFVINPTIFKRINYSVTRDFVPVALVVSFPLILSVNGAVPAKSVKELVEFLRKNAGRNNCGGSGGTFELAVRLLTDKTGTECTFIRYKGSNETAQALLTGDLHFALSDAGPVFPLFQSGKVRALAVTTPQRDPTFPDLPSVVEAGFPDLEMRFWMGLFAPAGTPPPIVRRIEGETVRIVKTPETAKLLENRQVMPTPMGSEEFGRFVAAEMQRWDAVRKAAKIEQLD
jgi:tripartite-type tricarboxylate transporter receptor subunit TctC